MESRSVFPRAILSSWMLIYAIAATAQTSPTPVNCRPIPYTVGYAVKGAEVATMFGAGALGKLANLPNFSGRAGGEIVKTAYAGMNSQAMSDVFDVLGCRVKAFIKDTDADAEKKRAAVTMAVARLNGEMAFIQSAYATGFDAVGTLKELYLNAARSETAPVLDSAITSEALRSIDTDALFINNTQKEFWVKLDFPSNISVSACGGVVKAAISDGGSALQVSLAATRDILINYLDPKTPPVVALSKLLASTTPPTFRPSQELLKTFKSCTQDLAKTTSKQAEMAAATPVTPATPATPATGPGKI